MADINVTPGSGKTVSTETIGGVEYQRIKVLDGTATGTTGLKVNADGSISASVYGNIGFSGSPSISGAVTIVGNASISGTVGASVVGLPPVNITQIQGGGVGVVGSGTTGVNTLRVTMATDSAGFGSVVAFQGGNRTLSGSVLAYMAPLSSLVSGVTSIITSTSITAVLASAPGGQRNYITHILVTNAAATGAFVDIKDGGTVLLSGFAAASGGGFSASFPTPLRQASVSAVVDMQASAQASIKTAISGFTA